ncbi:hypothetical protein GCM10009839_93330 [Catenulispora yoronensis]|uniref:N-acetyltransferase domain-containing protein n=1 Tax=Catenulispora yoronensis TaxID=450799 RepID=A0ABN2VN32_9ACTN
MPTLRLLHADDAPAVLAFELENRAYFAATITDRGDHYFEHFDDGFRARLIEQYAGVCAFYVLVDEDGAVLGRFNLIDIEDGGAVLGYRVAERAGGRGVATAAVRELCRVAPERHGLRMLRAAVAQDNPASRKVLMNAGFVGAGPADPSELGGQTGSRYRRDLMDGATFPRSPWTTSDHDGPG